MSWLLTHLDPITLVQAFGHLGLFGVIFAETGLFFGFFFPGDSLLFTAGLLASQGYLNIMITLPIAIAGAIVGDSFGYWFGKKVGPRIFTREDSLIFHKRHIERTHTFYIKYGPRAVVLARFVPIVRTFTPILAGVGSMPYSTFIRYNIIGGITWGGGVLLLGYFLGRTVPAIEHYLLPVIGLIVALSFLPIVYEFIKSKAGR